ncbi:hypothetical protein RIF29_09946 [Crotalaria pallida]|uniref:Uncharacterized protein n=1 Tax=Crotalaria pallida TaxID=3830 RepID=A0AAN9FYI7_CROPI
MDQNQKFGTYKELIRSKTKSLELIRSHHGFNFSITSLSLWLHFQTMKLLTILWHCILRASKILAEMRSTFGTSNSLLLCINSSPDAPIKHEENPWASFISDASTSPDLGCFLNIEDISEVSWLLLTL